METRFSASPDSCPHRRTDVHILLSTGTSESVPWPRATDKHLKYSLRDGLRYRATGLQGYRAIGPRGHGATRPISETA